MTDFDQRFRDMVQPVVVHEIDAHAALSAMGGRFAAARRRRRAAGAVGGSAVLALIVTGLMLAPGRQVRDVTTAIGPASGSGSESSVDAVGKATSGNPQLPGDNIAGQGPSESGITIDDLTTITVPAVGTASSPNDDPTTTRGTLEPATAGTSDSTTQPVVTAEPQPPKPGDGLSGPPDQTSTTTTVPGNPSTATKTSSCGSISVRASGGGVTLISANALPGFSTRTKNDGSETVRVEFENDYVKCELKAKLVDGSIVFDIEEEPAEEEESGDEHSD